MVKLMFIQRPNSISECMPSSDWEFLHFQPNSTLAERSVVSLSWLCIGTWLETCLETSAH